MIITTVSFLCLCAKKSHLLFSVGIKKKKKRARCVWTKGTVAAFTKNKHTYSALLEKIYKIFIVQIIFRRDRAISLRNIGFAGNRRQPYYSKIQNAYLDEPTYIRLAQMH